MQEIKYEDLDATQKNLLSEAEKVMETAYNPYSKFYVGVALLSKDDQIVTGSNVESASYGSSICAERAALLRANAKGIRSFKKVALIGRGEDFNTKEVTAPCGECRQALFEFAQLTGIDFEIILSTTKKDKIIIATIKELLPLAFGPRDLEVDVKKYL
jgi:cytidine deaminase